MMPFLQDPALSVHSLIPCPDAPSTEKKGTQFTHTQY